MTLRMVQIGLVLAMFCASMIEATSVNFVNRCSFPIQLVKTQNNNPAVLECDLPSNTYCERSYGSWSGNFKHGWGGAAQGVTLAEFTFHGWSNLDYYDLSVIDGYNVPMQIQSGNGGPTVTCNDSQCPDAYLYPSDNSKVHTTSAGGKFTVTFCP